MPIEMNDKIKSEIEKKNTFLYRDQSNTEGYHKSMEAVQEFKTLNDLRNYLNKKYEYLKGDLVINKYGMGLDIRNNWYTHIVIIGNQVVGFTNKAVTSH